MFRKRTIVGIGEALLCEYPDRVEPGGLAVNVAAHAVRLGHTGIAISRLGQDAVAGDLLQRITSLGVDISHLQSDPDHPTGRLTVRSIAGRTSRSLQPHAAFDNMQWDFDLVDVAQQADATIFGDRARRSGLTRSIIKRFLAECSNALRVFDLTNRASDDIDRVEARRGLELAQVAVVDTTAIQALVPGWHPPDVAEAVARISRMADFMFIVVIERGDCTEQMTVFAGDESSRGESFPSSSHHAAVVGLLHGVLSGWDFAQSLECANRVAHHVAKTPDQPIPSEWL